MPVLALNNVKKPFCSPNGAALQAPCPQLGVAVMFYKCPQRREVQVALVVPFLAKPRRDRFARVVVGLVPIEIVHATGQFQAFGS